ncbi:phage portal protein [[Actinobacillus] muris]|uniref:Phage portal protein n=1 Tax=Muribacter muris TaxID=67855 RepID=A0A0J5P4X9_9PAST|nr:phage portal protein [Muribacter muris]KMK51483.1 phage portal protein [[Actinobacillus] muris] [Muribacter muris]
MKKQRLKQKSKPAQPKHFSAIPFGSDHWEISPPPALDYIGLRFSDQFEVYEPPLNRFALTRLPRQNAQHGGILNSRANMISANYHSGGLSKMDMRALSLNLIQYGDVGVLKVRNGFGKVVRLVVLSSLYLRKMKNGNYRYLMRKSLFDSQSQTVYEYPENDVIFLKLYDPEQQVYGVPDYIGGIQSALLNNDATTFRRRYFNNGAHMGFILYTTDPDINEEMEKEIKHKIEQSKGVGNFKSLFVNIPNGHPDGLKLIPVGDTGKKDEFGTIKDVSAQDIFTAHRYPPGLGGIIPSVGSIGDVAKIREAYRLDEVLPMQAMIAEAVNSDPEITGNLRITFLQPQNIE